MKYPQEVLEILESFEGENKELYSEYKRVQQELNQIGWDCDYDMSGEIFDVLPIKERYVEMIINYLPDNELKSISDYEFYVNKDKLSLRVISTEVMYYHNDIINEIPLDTLKRLTTLAECLHYWDKFGDISTNDEDEIEVSFQLKNKLYPKGTDRFEIWHDFESIFGISIGNDLM